MNISLIAAMDKNRLIGGNNQMPWHLPADLAHFKRVTMGKPIVMGRKTFESIGRPLPGRRNVVITRQQDYAPAGCEVFLSLEAALNSLQMEKEIMLIGGGQLFELLLPKASTLYLTLIDAEFEGDTYFPKWDQKSWSVIEEVNHKADEKNAFNYTFLTLKRV